MKRKASDGKTAGISSEAVKAKTGKTWEQWFAILDKAGVATMSHGEISDYLHEKHGVPSWWTQMVAVGFEQARGLRQKYQKADGFAATASRTISAPVSAVFESWEDSKARRAWLGAEKITIRKATPNKSMRITWSDGKTSVEVNFNAKGAERSQVAVQHTKLGSSREVQKMKRFWSSALDQLKSNLE